MAISGSHGCPSLLEVQNLFLAKVASRMISKLIRLHAGSSSQFIGFAKHSQLRIEPRTKIKKKLKTMKIWLSLQEKGAQGFMPQKKIQNFLLNSFQTLSTFDEPIQEFALKDLKLKIKCFICPQILQKMPLSFIIHKFLQVAPKEEDREIFHFIIQSPKYSAFSKFFISFRSAL